MAALEERGVLQNAIVVVYSDHGESFGFDAESMVPVDTSSLIALGAKPRYGHGTSVLAPHQYHCVLGIRGFGASELAARTVEVPVAIQDVAPTLVELLGAKTGAAFDGRSLVGLLRNDAAAPAAFDGRIRFTETEYDPANVISPNGQVSGSAIASAIQIYRVDPKTDRIEIDRSQLDHLLASRQYAAVGSEYLVAAIPLYAGFEYVAVNQRSGVLTRLTGEPQADQPAEVHALWSALNTEFDQVLHRKPQGAPLADLSRTAGGL